MCESDSNAFMSPPLSFKYIGALRKNGVVALSGSRLMNGRLPYLNITVQKNEVQELRRAALMVYGWYQLVPPF